MSNFEGWINIRRLPFNKWTNETFHSTGSMCGGTVQIDPHTKDLSNLFEARIRVKPQSSWNSASGLSKLKINGSLSNHPQFTIRRRNKKLRTKSNNDDLNRSSKAATNPNNRYKQKFNGQSQSNQIPSQATLGKTVVTTKRSHGPPTKLRLW